MPEEHRKYKRMVLPEDKFKVKIKNTEQEMFDVKVKDISKGGIGIIADSYDCYDENYMVFFYQNKGGQYSDFCTIPAMSR